MFNEVILTVISKYKRSSAIVSGGKLFPVLKRRLIEKTVNIR